MHPKHTCSRLQGVSFWVAPQPYYIQDWTHLLSLLHAPPPRNTYTLYLLLGWIVTHLSSYWATNHDVILDSSLSLSPLLLIGHNFLTLLLYSCNLSRLNLIMCIAVAFVQALGSSLPDFFISLNTDFPIFIPTVLPNLNPFFRCFDGDIYKTQFRLC